MAGFDVSPVAAQVAVPQNQFNPLQTLEGLAGLQNSLNQNKMFQAKAVAGQYLQQSIGPDGQPDMGKFSAGLQSDPRTAPYAPEILQEAASLRQTGIANTGAEAQRRSAMMDRIYGVAGQFPKGTDPSLVRAGLQALVQAGAVDQPTMDAVAPAGDNAGLANLQLRGALSAQGTGAEQEGQGGNIQAINTGGAIQPTTVNPFSPGGPTVAPAAAAIPVTLTPGEKAARVGYVDQSTGVPGSVPVGSVTTDTGEPKPLAGVTGPGGTLATGLPPGAGAGFDTAGSGNAQMALGLASRAAGAPDRKALLGNLQGTLQNFQPGPQSDFWKGMQQLAQEYHLPLGAPPADGTAAQEEFAKLSIQLAQQQFQSLGGTGTDAQLSSTVHTSPSEFLTKLGNEGIISLLKGNEDAISAQNDAWQKWQAHDPVHNGPNSFGRFQSQWNKIYDPRVFQTQYMSQPQRQTMLKGMSEAEQAKFKQDYERAAKLGWVNGQ